MSHSSDIIFTPLLEDDKDIKCVTVDDYILLQRDIDMISSMYRDLHTMVDQQQEKLDYVENEIDKTRIYVEISSKEIHEASMMSNIPKIVCMTLATGFGCVIGYPICVILGTPPIIGIIVGGLSGLISVVII